MSVTRSHSGASTPDQYDVRALAVCSISWVGGRTSPPRLAGLALAQHLEVAPGDVLVAVRHRREGVARLDRRALRHRGEQARAPAVRGHHGHQQVVVPGGVADPLDEGGVQPVLPRVGQDAEAGDGLPHRVGGEPDGGHVVGAQQEIDVRRGRARTCSFGRLSSHRPTSWNVIQSFRGDGPDSVGSPSDNRRPVDSGIAESEPSDAAEHLRSARILLRSWWGPR